MFFLQPVNIVLSLSNPAHRITTVRLRQLTTEEEGTQLARFFNKTKPVGTKEPPASQYSTVQVFFQHN